MDLGIQSIHSQALQVLVAGKLYTPDEIAGPVAIVLEGSKIRAIWRDTNAAEARQRVEHLFPGLAVDVTDLGTWRLAPGYIDLHIHGFRGHDITTGPAEDTEAVARDLPCTGVTSFFPTIATTGRTETVEQVKNIATLAEKRPNASSEILGIRLEGPFISYDKKGAQYGPAIRKPDPAEMRQLAEIGNGWIRFVDYAPEEDDKSQLLASLVELDIYPCIGHTSATYEQAVQAIDGGARHSTHLFNAMPTLNHRAPGAAGALLTDNRATVEIIADGIHVHPRMLKLAIAARGIHDVALITDAVSPAGLPDGDYEFVRRIIHVADGKVCLEDGSLAGSALTLDRAVRNMVAFGASWADAIRMATLTPARIAGIAKRKGQVAPGADADLVVLDEHGLVRGTWVNGQRAYFVDAHLSKA
ncbi:N-acetylglucosamine-6-phosphate deacetylase [Ktedonosporobacter rubrisoli]|uniref:N-acetylglucosamine-6-phosphate deacetylase n=1 Tax=Ktedonosporobacter rubrisoli TaxID=2509675 RepID=A0A4P6JQR9_KTERU|nr:N-acetylglucosamine-6-phosphate deacetylase [Ktedonosporobacter rubrisoli]QBD77778.1 N-acetylglucosamine-6-phosphate deacetylase [Ktedonosporobacter rubrisoli]